MSPKEFSRWHIEKHLLGLTLRPRAVNAHALPVADTLIPENWISPNSVCYCAGVGEDIRFDRYLVENLGAQVWAFDPTPRAINYMSQCEYDRTRLHFLPVGLWCEDATLRFYAPKNSAHVSHSVMGSQGSDNGFEAPCLSLRSVMLQLGHDRLDLLKLNIEGAEHVVLQSAIDSRILPNVICLTYEGSGAFRKAHVWTRRLRQEGYELLGRKAWFFTYIRKSTA
jgi:FkbM family methyltransferase